MLKASPILALCCPSWPTLSLPSYALSSPQPLYVPRCDVSSFAVREMSDFSCFLLSHPTFVLAVWHCWVVDVAGAGVPSPSHCLGYLGFISDALRLLSSPCPLWGGGGEEVGWGGEGLPALPGHGLPCRGYVAVEGGAGGRDEPSHHCTHHSGRRLEQCVPCRACSLPGVLPPSTAAASRFSLCGLRGLHKAGG